MEEKEIIEKLQNGEKYIFPEGDYGKAEVWRINDMYVLFSIPQYGGSPVFDNTFPIKDIKFLIETVHNWT